MIRTGVSVLGWVLLVAGVLASSTLLVLRHATALHDAHSLVIVAASFIPLLWIPALVACLGLILVLRAQWRLLGAAALIVTMAFFAWPLRPVGEQTPVPIVVGAPLTVVSVNLEYGSADVAEISALAGAEVDVLALQEYTPTFAEELEESGLLEQFPHQAGVARDGAGGSMLLSRTPLEPAARTEGTVFENLIASTTVEGTEWHIGVIHTAPPQLGAEAWARDAAAVGEMAEPFLNENLLLIGDFNAIDQHHTMRQLTADGSLDNLASWRRGEGLQWHPTWPTGTWIPPFVRIDHALVSDPVIGWMPRFETVSGTDHKALTVEVSELQ